jgi:hypothetical protein
MTLHAAQMIVLSSRQQAATARAYFPWRFS